MHHIRVNTGKDGTPVSYTVRLELGPHPVTGERRWSGRCGAKACRNWFSARVSSGDLMM